MFLGAVYKAFDQTRDRARDFLDRGGYKPKIFSAANVRTFFGALPEVVRLIAREPEILLFAGLQWLVIGLGYVAWTQVLRWIPDAAWDAVREASEQERKGAFTLLNLVLLGWSFLIVCVASYPIGVCNAAMVAVHDLRASGERVTIGRCLAIAGHHLGRIWLFTIVDSWITVSAILDRLPRKHYHRTALDELLYYAWKLATMAVVPALVNGRSFLNAGRDSFLLLTEQPQRALALRLGYSAVCWVVGVLSYAGAAFLLVRSGMTHQGPHFIYNAYFLAAAPVVIAVGVVAVLVRPFYLLSVAAFYTELVDVKEEIERDVASEPHWEQVLFSGKFLLFAMLLIAVFSAVFYAPELGLTQWIDHLAAIDLSAYYGER